jgi:hypothetical protein
VRASRLWSARLCQPVEHVVEVAAVAELNGRVRASAARFEDTTTGLRCVAGLADPLNSSDGT